MSTMGNWNRNDFHLGALNVVVLFLSMSVSHSADPGKTNIKLVVALFRHSQRVPGIFWETYNTDPNKNATFPEGTAQLTSEGKRSAYKLGMTFREKYDDFLGKSYFYTEVDARSTDMARTVMTLEMVLAGMYVPSPEQAWNDELPWQPVYITSVPTNQDHLLLPGIATPLYKRATEEAANTTEAKAEIAKFQKVFDDLTEKTGSFQGLPISMLLLYQTLAAQSGVGLTLPTWTNEYFPNGKLKEGTLLYYRLENYNDTLKRLNGGILLQKIIHDMEAKKNGTSEKKVFLYCAQDVTVVALMNVLGVFDNEPPTYCSAIVLELHESDGKYFVKIVYHRGYNDEKTELVIPGCAALCPFDDFRSLTAKFMPLAHELANLGNQTETSI